MEAKQVFDAFLTDLKSAFPEIEVKDYDLEKEVKHIEDTFLPAALKILQKDETFFTETPRIVCGINLSELWKSSESNREAIWKHIFMVGIASFMHGDIKEKIGKILETVKGIWSSSGHENDEISKILNDEEAEGNFKEILDYIQNTRLAKMFMELVEETNVEEFVGDFNFENPEEIIEILRNPDHPKIKPFVAKMQLKVQEKLQRGQYSQQQLVAEIEGVKAKVQSIFGNVINEMLGGRRGETPANVLMGNSPEARRQRMLARLQKKQREKNSR